MNKLKAKFISLMLICSMILTGCINEEINMKINADGTSTFTITESIEKDKFVKKCKAGGMKQSEIDSCLKSFISSGYKLTTIDGKDFYVATKTSKSKKGELSKQFKAYDENAYLSTTAVYFVLDLNKIPEVAELVAQAKDGGYKLSGDDISININLEFPYKIANTTGKRDAQNSYKVSFTANLSHKTVVFASTKDSITTASFAKPAKTKISTLKAHTKNGKSYADIKYKKSKLATKYQIQYSKKSNKGFKTVNTTKLSAKIKKLTKETKYYFRVRAVRKLYNGKLVYSQWAKKTVVTPKK